MVVRADRTGWSDWGTPESIERTLDTLHRGVRDPHRDFSEWLEHWKLLDRLTRSAR